MSAMERNCTLLLHGKEATPPNEEEIRELLEVQAVARHPLHRRASGRVAQTAAFSARPLTLRPAPCLRRTRMWRRSRRR